MIESPAVSHPDEGPFAAVQRPGGARLPRPLTPVDRLIRVPLGFLWLGVLALLAVPVMLSMTLLYYAARGLALLPPVRWPGRRRDGESEERVA